MAKRLVINSPILNELAFDYLFTMSPGHRQKLSAKEIRAIKSPARARQYVSRSTLDEKLYFLAKMGVQFSFMLHDNNSLATKDVKELYNKYKDMSKLEVIENMAANRFVVVSDRVLINFLNIMAHNSHSDTYLLNLDFHKVGSHLNNWKIEDRPDAEKIQEYLEFARVINRFALNLAIEFKTMKGVTQMGDLDFNLLMFLYESRTKYVPREKIESYFGGLYKKTLIAAAIKRLVEKVFIEKNPVCKESEYQITALGNTNVMDFHKKVLAMTV